jgi:DNA-binding beta-propeller fold protein YncE
VEAATRTKPLLWNAEEADMTFGEGTHTYRADEGWGRLPEGWSLGWTPAVGVDSKDRIYVYSRSEHPVIVFDREGSFLCSWGEDILKDAHGICIDSDDIIYCVERETHCVRKLTSDGELLMTLGTPDMAGAVGEPFRKPTDLGIDSSGFLYISDGYDNACVHKYSPDGEHVLTWGKPGTGPGEFDLPHSVKVDREDRIMVADRANNRIQIFDTEGKYLTEWTGLHHPDTLFIDREDVVYVAELDHRVSIWTLEGERLAEWGGGAASETPGEFLGCPHGIWTDSKGDLYVGEVRIDNRYQKFVRVGS